MQSFYPEAFERDMACTEADWLRWLPNAIGDTFYKLHEGSAGVRPGVRQISPSSRPEPQ